MKSSPFLHSLCLFAAFASVTAQEVPEGGAIHRFDGTIGDGLAVTLLLNVDDESLGTVDGATYHYRKSGIPITLLMEGDQGIAPELKLKEIGGYTADGEEKVTGIWDVKREGDVISGTWSSPDGKKKLPVKLKESYPDGSVKVIKQKLNFSYTEQIGSTRRGIEREVELLQTPSAPELNKQLGELATKAADPDAKPAEVTPESISKFLREQVRKDGDLDSYVDSNSEDFDIRMNDSGFLTVENFSYSYSGGAHGNHASTFHVLEIATGKSLQLTDLVKPGFEKKWAALGAVQIRKERGAKPNAPLTEAGLFEDKLDLSEE